MPKLRYSLIVYDENDDGIVDFLENNYDIRFRNARKVVHFGDFEELRNFAEKTEKEQEAIPLVASVREEVEEERSLKINRVVPPIGLPDNSQPSEVPKIVFDGEKERRERICLPNEEVKPELIEHEPTTEKVKREILETIQGRIEELKEVPEESEKDNIMENYNFEEYWQDSFAMDERDDDRFETPNYYSSRIMSNFRYSLVVYEEDDDGIVEFLENNDDVSFRNVKQLVHFRNCEELRRFVEDTGAETGQGPISLDTTIRDDGQAKTSYEEMKEQRRIAMSKYRVELRDKIRRNSLTVDEKQRIERMKESNRIRCRRYRQAVKERKRLKMQTEYEKQLENDKLRIKRMRETQQEKETGE